MKKHIIVITTGGTIAMKTDPVTGGLVPAVSSIVPSAGQVLTVVFGLGTGVSPDRIDTRIL